MNKPYDHALYPDDPDFKRNPIKNSLSHIDNPGSRWDTGEFRVKRICTCSSKSVECGPGKYHVVDSYQSPTSALDEAQKLNAQTNLPASPTPYIVVKRSTGRPAGDPTCRYCRGMPGYPCERHCR